MKVQTVKREVKLAIVATIASALWFGVPFVYHVGQRVVHWATEPDKTICVQSHYNYIWQTSVISTGKSTYTTTHLVPIYICDKEAPNPKYQEQMEKWRNK